MLSGPNEGGAPILKAGQQFNVTSEMVAIETPYGSE
jgi:hypothetical protein